MCARRDDTGAKICPILPLMCASESLLARQNWYTIRRPLWPRLLGWAASGNASMALEIRLVCCSIAAVAASTAQARDAAPAQVAEIVVTAQKMSQSLQDVPIAVTAITGEQLSRLQNKGER